MKSKNPLRVFYVLAIPVLLFFVFSLLAPGFGIHSIPILLSQSLLTYVEALGLCFIMTTGIFDLSFGTQIMIISLICARLTVKFGIVGFFVGSFLGAMLMAGLVGTLYKVLKIPSIVLSIGMVMIIEYIGRLIAGHQGAISINPDISKLGKTPYSYIFVLIAVVIFCFLYYKTKIGQHIKLVGDNELIAIQIGVNAEKVKFLSYFLCGIFSGIAAILNLCYSGTISAAVGMASMSMVFRPMMAVMIAMTLLNVYNVIVINLFVSVLSVIIIFNGVIACGIPSNMEKVILGTFMLIVLILSSNIDVWKEKQRRKRARNEIEKSLSL